MTERITDPQRRIAALSYAAACVEQGAESPDALAIGIPTHDLYATKAALYAIAADLRRQAEALRQSAITPDTEDDAPTEEP